MRSYKVDTDKLVNQLVPYYMGGRKLILFIQSCLQPLKSLATEWKDWADATRIEASITSQVILLEHFLNRKYRKYFADSSQRITISDGSINGVPVYWENNSDTSSINLLLYTEAEKTQETPSESFSWEGESSSTSDVSFVVNCPTVNTSLISEDELKAMITYWVNRYRIAQKTFIVTFK